MEYGAKYSGQVMDNVVALIDVLLPYWHDVDIVSKSHCEYLGMSRIGKPVVGRICSGLHIRYHSQSYQDK